MMHLNPHLWRIIVFWLELVGLAAIFAFLVSVVSDNRDLFGFKRRPKDYDDDEEDE